MQKLLVFQALWAMERRHTDGFERSLEENVRMIAEAGFDGISSDWRDRDKCRRMSELMKAHNLTAEGQCFPKTVDDLKPALENATEFRLHHLDIQPDIRPRKLNDCIPLIEGWRRLAEEVDFPVYIETHRDRMTTDLFFVLDLLECFPDLKLLADLSHFLVGREFAWPIDEENHSYIHEILDHSWAFHGRVASREQVQIEISSRTTRCGSTRSSTGGNTVSGAGGSGRGPTTPAPSSASSGRNPTPSPDRTATTPPTAGPRR